MTDSPSPDGLDGIDWLLLASIGLERAQEQFSDETAERILDARGHLGRIRTAAVRDAGLHEQFDREDNPFGLENHLRYRTKRLRDYLEELEEDTDDA